MNNRRRQKIKGKGPKFTSLELWNLNDTLAAIILSGLKQFKHMKRMGYPGEPNIEADTPEKWEILLDEFIWVFNEIANDYLHDPISVSHNKFYKEKYPNGITFGDFNSLFEDSPDKDGYKIYKGDGFEITEDLKNESEIYRKRISDGLVLFAKYFEHLWD